MDQIWLWLWWWVFDPTRFILAFIWIATIVGICMVEWRRWRRGTPVPQADPNCPKCGYLLIGLAGQVCPECGTDLGKEGVLREDDPRTRPIGRIALWGILLTIPAIQAWRHIEPRLPTLNEASFNAAYPRPTSNAFASITLVFPYRDWRWPGQRNGGIAFDRLDLHLVTSQGNERVFRTRLRVHSNGERARFATMPYPATTPAPATQASDLSDVLDLEALNQWLREQGVNVDDPQVRDEVLTVAAFIDGTITGSPKAGPDAGFGAGIRLFPASGFSGRPRWMLAGYIGVCIILWLFGAKLLGKRSTLPYRRILPPRLTEPRPTTPDTHSRI